MKKLRILLTVTTLAGLSACMWGKRHTTIVETGSGHYLKIESWGKVYFNHEKSAIAYISPGGRLRYQLNDNVLEAENDGHGGIKYLFDIHGEKMDMQGKGKPFIAEAVKTMLRKGYRGD